MVNSPKFLRALDCRKLYSVMPAEQVEESPMCASLKNHWVRRLALALERLLLKLDGVFVIAPPVSLGEEVLEVDEILSLAGRILKVLTSGVSFVLMLEAM